jgi:hypothetical protein
MTLHCARATPAEVAGLTSEECAKLLDAKCLTAFADDVFAALTAECLLAAPPAEVYASLESTGHIHRMSLLPPASWAG